LPPASSLLYATTLSPSSVVLHDPSTTEIYTLSLHDALPISRRSAPAPSSNGNFAACTRIGASTSARSATAARGSVGCSPMPLRRSEEHTSELQSRENLVCRLLLEKKKTKRRCTRKLTRAQEW